MAKVIWKFPLSMTDWQDIMVPRGAKIISAGQQHDQLVVWAIVDDEYADEKEARAIYINGTGHPMDGIPAAATFIGTVETHGHWVWHIFAENPIYG